MRLKPQTAGQSLRSVLILFAIVGNLVFSVVFVMSMGAHVAQTGTDIEQTAEKNTNLSSCRWNYSKAAAKVSKRYSSTFSPH